MNALPSSALMIHFKDYERFHQTKGNKYTHIVGVPLVLISLLGLLAHVVLWAPSPDSLFRIDLGIILFFCGAIFSLRVDKKLSVPYLLFCYLSYLLARHLSISTLVILQVIAWVFQLWGHYAYEKKSPAFLNSMSHLFIGPMWIFAWIIGYYRPSTN